MRMKGFILSFSQSIEKKLLRFSSSPPAPTSNEKNLRCVVMIVSSRQKGMKAIERRSGVVKNERKGITKAFLSVEQVGKKGGGGSLSSELTNTKKFSHSNVTRHSTPPLHAHFSTLLLAFTHLSPPRYRLCHCCAAATVLARFSFPAHSILSHGIAWNAKIYTLFVLQTKYILGSCWLLRHKKRGEIFLLEISSFVIFPEFQFFFCCFESIG